MSMVRSASFYPRARSMRSRASPIGLSGIAVAKQMAGHKDIATTDRYSHLETGDLAQALISVYHLGEDD